MSRRITLAALTALALGAGLLASTPAQAAPVKRSVSITKPATVTVGSTAAFYGKLTRSPKGSVVVIQRKVGKAKWRKFRQVTTRDGAGSFVFKASFGSTTAVAFRARAPKRRVGSRMLRATTSRAVTVRPTVAWVSKHLDREWKPFDGSGTPGFVTYSYGYEADFPRDTTPNTTAYLTWDLQGKCVNGMLRLGSHSWSNGGDLQFTIEADGIQLDAFVVGAQQQREREVNVTGRSKLTISATYLEGNTSQRYANVWSESFLRCWSTL